MNKETVAMLMPWIIVLVIVLMLYSFLNSTKAGGGNSSGQSLWNYFFGSSGKFVPGVGYVGSTADPATTNDLKADNGAIASSKSVNTWGDDVTYILNSGTDWSSGAYDTSGNPD